MRFNYLTSFAKLPAVNGAEYPSITTCTWVNDQYLDFKLITQAINIHLIMYFHTSGYCFQH